MRVNKKIVRVRGAKRPPSYTKVKEDALFARSFATLSGLRVGKEKKERKRRKSKIKAMLHYMYLLQTGTD